MERKLLAFFHSVVLAHYLGASFYLQRVQDENPAMEEMNKMKVYKLRMVTFWNLIVYFSLALVYDCLKSFEKRERGCGQLRSFVKSIKGTLLVSSAFPGTVITVTVFWGVCAFDRELIYPRVFDAIIPEWANHCVHTNIAIALLIETLLVKQRLPTYKLAFSIFTVITLAYKTIFLLTYFQDGVWIYKLFAVLDWPQRVLTLIILYLIGFVSLNAVYFVELRKISKQTS